VDVRISTVEEAAERVTVFSAPGAARTVRPNPLPIEDYLRRHYADDFSPGDRIASLATAAVAASDALLNEGWALRRLADHFPPAKVSRLKTQSVWLLETMIRDHLAGIKTHAAEERKLLDAPLRSLADDRRNPSGPALDWREQILACFGRAQAISRLTLALFAGDTPVPTDPGAAAATLLAELDTLLEEPESILTRSTKE
jgi:hypothetical protein